MQKNMTAKPKLSGFQIWSMSMGFMGIQMGFALQNANASRILQTFGANVEHLSWFWLVAPITGMIIQPIIGHYSDNTWTRLGRRRPYFLAGAILASVGLILMPNAAIFAAVLPALWVGAGMLMIMDASFNISMEPFRALVADKLPSEQRTQGFSVQTILIGIGAVIGSWLPYVLAEWLGIGKSAAPGEVPMNLIISFITGAVVLLATIIWTVVTTKEYSPEELEQFDDHVEEPEGTKASFADIFKDFVNMPKTMRQLGWVQFFTWFALYSMWVFTTPAIAQHVFGLPADDTSSDLFQEAGNWVGVIFGVYNAISAIFAFFLPKIAAKVGRKKTHAISLTLGGLGLISFFFIHNKYWLILSMFGVGIAWASILAMPYAILAGSLPIKKMGVYMGIFNFFITFPQMLNGIFGGYLIKYLYGGQAVMALVFAGVFLIFAAIAVLRVDDVDAVVAA